MAIKVDFDYENSLMRTRLTRYSRAVPDAIVDYLDAKANEMVYYMKANHLWRNRTGNAERTLHYDIRKSRENYLIRIKLSHGVWYGYRLETWFGRRYAILEPTLKIYGPQVMRDLYQFQEALRL